MCRWGKGKRRPPSDMPRRPTVATSKFEPSLIAQVGEKEATPSFREARRPTGRQAADGYSSLTGNRAEFNCP
ncbi:unnamed protein product [Urochloa humidicola]